MILILNDTAHCWENETSVAASPFECPCEFIKSTSFPRSNSDLHSCTSLKEYSRTKSLSCRTECRINIFVRRYSLWQWALPNIYYVKDYFLLENFLFQGISAVQIAHRVEEREEMWCYAGYYPHLTSHFKAYGTSLIPASERDAQLKRYLLYFSK